jgi:hypothetical protein
VPVDFFRFRPGNCEYFAIRDALNFFLHIQYPPSERSLLQEILKAEWEEYYPVASQLSFEFPLTQSLGRMLPRLEHYNIIPERIITTQLTINNIRDTQVLNQQTGLEFKAVPLGKVEVEFPSLIFIYRQKGSPHAPHVWFCPDWEAFDRNHKKHLRGESDYVPLMVVLKKKD